MPGPDRRRRAERRWAACPSTPCWSSSCATGCGSSGSSTRHPEIRDIEIEAPIIVAGLPRTGTTHLHNLMSADPALRSLPYWESPGAGARPTTSGASSPTRGGSAATWPSGSWTRPCRYFKRMHEMTTDHVHEEIQLLAMDFSTMLFESVVPLPTYRDWWKATDQTRQLPLPEGRAAGPDPRAGRRPLGAQVAPAPRAASRSLAEVFPDATFVVTHRDPSAVTAVDGHDGRLLRAA